MQDRLKVGRGLRDRNAKLSLNIGAIYATVSVCLLDNIGEALPNVPRAE